jgi:hypothetical protein
VDENSIKLIIFLLFINVSHSTFRMKFYNKNINRNNGSHKYNISNNNNDFTSKSIKYYTSGTIKPQHKNINLHHEGHLVLEKITRDTILILTNSNNKPNLNMGGYIKDIFKDILHHKFQNISINGAVFLVGEGVIIPLKVMYFATNYSNCMNHEITYLMNNNIYFNDNHKTAKNICIINTMAETFSGETKILSTIIGTSFSTAIEVVLEKSYLNKPLNHNWFVNRFNNIQEWYNRHISYNTYKFIDNAIHKPIDYVLDFAIDKSYQLVEHIYKYCKKKMINDNYSNIKNSYVDNLFPKFTIQDISYNINEDIINENDFIENKNEPDIIINTTLQKISSILNGTEMVINIVMIFENFKTNPELIIIELEKLLVNMKSHNYIFNGIFNIIADLTINKKFTIESIKTAIYTTVSNIIEIPISNVANLIENIIKQKDISKLIIPTFIDLCSIAIPGIGLINILINVKHLIESMFTHQHIVDFGNIQATYTDKFKIGFFKISHEVSLNNNFFGIHISKQTRHANDAKNFCYKEFEKQLNYKVYQVIGIPINFINDTYDKPITRLDNFKLATYLHNIKSFWYKINEKYLTEEQQEALYDFYFKSDNVKKYEYCLIKQGLKPSWIYQHRTDSVIIFCKNIYSECNKIICNKLDFSGVNLTVHGMSILYHQICKFIDEFINLFKPSKTTTIINPEKYYNDLRYDGWENARIMRNNYHTIHDLQDLYTFIIKKVNGDEQINDNDLLTAYENNETNDYNNDDGKYSYDELLILSVKQLWEIQKSIEYLFESVSVNIINIMGQNIAYIDKEIYKIIDKPLTYVPNKIKRLSVDILKFHAVKTITHQIFNLFSILKCTQFINDEILMNYCYPIINCATHIVIYSIISICNNYKNKNKNILNSIKNISVSMCLNTSCGCIYSYGYKANIISYFINNEFINKIISLSCNFIHTHCNIIIPYELMTTILLTIAINIVFRLLTSLYEQFNMKNQYINTNNIDNIDNTNILRQASLFEIENQNELPILYEKTSLIICDHQKKLSTLEDDNINIYYTNQLNDELIEIDEIIDIYDHIDL